MTKIINAIKIHINKTKSNYIFIHSFISIVIVFFSIIFAAKSVGRDLFLDPLCGNLAKNIKKRYLYCDNLDKIKIVINHSEFTQSILENNGKEYVLEAAKSIKNEANEFQFEIEFDSTNSIFSQNIPKKGELLFRFDVERFGKNKELIVGSFSFLAYHNYDISMHILCDYDAKCLHKDTLKKINKIIKESLNKHVLIKY